MTQRSVEFWFDFVSGYSWIAFLQAEQFAADHNIRWIPRPFVLGAVIDKIERKTVAQIEATRRYAVFDVARQAHHLGFTLNGPPQHPFLSIRALRAAVLFQDTEFGIPVARQLFAAAWENNGDLMDWDVVTAAVAKSGAPFEDLQGQILAPETKHQLRENTDAALAAGIFGAPWFMLDGEPFWGQDRLPLLAERLGGKSGLDGDLQRRLLAGEAETAS